MPVYLPSLFGFSIKCFLRGRDIEFENCGAG